MLSVLFLTGTIIEFDKSIFIDISGINRYTDGSGQEKIGDTMIFTALLMLIPLISLVTIFLFRNRKQQIRLTILLLCLIVLEFFAVFYYINHVIRTYNEGVIPSVKLILPVLTLVFSFLALRGIRKDENIVRSYDRLR